MNGKEISLTTAGCRRQYVLHA